MQAYIDQLEKIQTYKLPPFKESKATKQEGVYSKRGLLSLKSNFNSFIELANKNNGIGQYLVDKNSKTQSEWESKLNELYELIFKFNLSKDTNSVNEIISKNQKLIKWSQEVLAVELELPLGFNSNDGD